LKRLVSIGLMVSLLLAACSEPAAPVPDPVAASQDQVAQADLRTALIAAKTYWADAATYAGWSPSAAAGIEPSLSWNDAAPAANATISIDFVSQSQVVMSTKSASGTAFCIADDAVGGVSYGTVDADGATGVSGCAGDAWPAAA